MENKVASEDWDHPDTELLTLCSWRKGFPVGSAPTVSGSAAPAHFINSWILLSPSTTQPLQAWVPDPSSFDPVVSDVSFGGFDRGQITGQLAFASDDLSGPQNSCNAKESYE